MADAPAARDPGAPIGKDEIDPDLVSLRRAAPKVGIVTSAAIVILCVVMGIRLWDDFAFSRSGDSPRTVTAEDVAAGKVGGDSYVSLVAPLDRSAAVRVRVTEANAGTRVVPVRGTDDKLWVALPGDAWSEVNPDDVVTGRLRPMSDVRFDDELAAEVKRAPAPRFITGDTLRKAKTSSGGGGAVALVGGGSHTLAPTDEIEISQIDPGAAVVVATFNPRLPTVQAWTAVLVEAGILAAGEQPVRATEETARWELRRPDAVADVTARIDGAQLWGARAEPATTRFRVAWSALAASDAGVTSPAGVIPWSAVDVVALWAPRTVPPGAKILLVDEKPDAYWYLMPVYVGLALFAVLFTWALVLAIRRTLADARAAPANKTA
jgi:hypothetical protein